MEHIENSTIFGLERNSLIWNTDFRATRDDKNKWVGSETFTCHLKSLTRLLPSKGAACQMEGFSFMTLTDLEVRNNEGDTAEVTCNYSGFQDGEDAGNDDNEPELEDYVYDLQITTGEEPVTTLPKYVFGDDKISKEEFWIIRNYLEGKFEPILDDNKDYTYDFLNSDNNVKGVKHTISSVQGKELVDLLAVGLDQYLVPRQVWRATYVSKKLPSGTLLNKVGKIWPAIGAPEIADNRDWLFNGASMQESNKLYTITLEWMLSGLGGWDDRVYETA